MKVADKPSFMLQGVKSPRVSSTACEFTAQEIEQIRKMTDELNLKINSDCQDLQLTSPVLSPKKKQVTKYTLLNRCKTAS